MNKLPLVSVIIPTTPDRAEYNQSILNQYLAQDYPNKEVLIDDKEGTVGAKRNRLCEQAKGEIILHMDSDDWYKPTWISESVDALQRSGAHITGLSTLYFFDKANDAMFKYDYGEYGPCWVAGATMCYWKSFWEQNKFVEINVGEDNSFVWGYGGALTPKVHSHTYIDGFLSLLHKGNTSPKHTDNSRWKVLEELKKENIKEWWNL